MPCCPIWKAVYRISMNPKKLRLVLEGSATVGVTVLAVVGMKEWIDKLWAAPSSVYKIAVIVGVGLIGLSAFMGALVYILLPIWGRAASASTQYDVVRVHSNQLDEFYALCKEVLGDEIATYDQMVRWYRKNPNVLYAVYALRHLGFVTKSKMVGFFSVFPVTKEAKELLQRNRLKGTELSASQITKLENAAAFYVGAIGASGFRAKQQTLAALLGYLLPLVSKKANVVFTHPVTKDGLRLARQRGFEPVLKSSSQSDDVIFFLRLR